MRLRPSFTGAVAQLPDGFAILPTVSQRASEWETVLAIST